jgi:hypothetical protein
MELKITNDTTLWALKKQFSSVFPNLKIEFVGQGHSCGQRPVMVRQVSDHVHLRSLKCLQKDGVFTFDRTTTVADFEEQMHKEFGLPVQVFRELDGSWIETKLTKDWSLGKQNAMSSATNRPYRFNSNSLFL